MPDCYQPARTHVRFWPIVVGVLILCATAYLAFADESPAPAPPTIHAAAQLNADDKADICTVFRVDANHVASAGHCVAVGVKYSVTLANGATVNVSIAGFGDLDYGLDDWSIFARTDKDPWPDTWDIAKLDCSGVAPPIGLNVRTEGYPHLSANFLVVWGRISGIPAPLQQWRFPVIPHNLALDGGNSGGPLYDDATNKVLGIVVGVNPHNQSLSVSQPIKPICDALHITN